MFFYTEMLRNETYSPVMLVSNVVAPPIVLEVMQRVDSVKALFWNRGPEHRGLG